MWVNDLTGNHANKRDRDHGKYYENQWNTAFSAMPGTDFLSSNIYFSLLTHIIEIISITSYNEWHEGNLYSFIVYVYLVCN